MGGKNEQALCAMGSFISFFFLTGIFKKESRAQTGNSTSKEHVQTR